VGNLPRTPEFSDRLFLILQDEQILEGNLNSPVKNSNTSQKFRYFMPINAQVSDGKKTYMKSIRDKEASFVLWLSCCLVPPKKTSLSTTGYEFHPTRADPSACPVSTVQQTTTLLSANTAFVSAPLLDKRFSVLKQSLVKPENKQRVIESYDRLLKVLESEIALIEKSGPSLVPEIDFNDIRENGGCSPCPVRIM
jgi:hypothetical protein